MKNGILAATRLLLFLGLFCGGLQARQSPAPGRQASSVAGSVAPQRRFHPLPQRPAILLQPSVSSSSPAQAPGLKKKSVSGVESRLRKPQKFNDIVAVFIAILMIGIIIGWFVVTIWGFIVHPWFGLFMLTIGALGSFVLLALLALLIIVLVGGYRHRPHPGWHPDDPLPEHK